MQNRRAILFSIVFLVSFLLVDLFKSSFAAVDVQMNSWAESIQIGSFTVVAKGISFAFDTYTLLILTLVAAAILFILHQWKSSLLLGGAMAGDAALVLVCKTLIQSPRPINELIPETGNSFPSGHVAGTLVFFGVLTSLIWQRWRSSKVKVSTSALYIAITFVVGFDRIYLNVHWFSDVIGASLLGAFWLAFVLVSFQILTLRFSKAKPLAAEKRVFSKT